MEVLPSNSLRAHIVQSADSLGSRSDDNPYSNRKYRTSPSDTIRRSRIYRRPVGIWFARRRRSRTHGNLDDDRSYKSPVWRSGFLVSKLTGGREPAKPETKQIKKCITFNDSKLMPLMTFSVKVAVSQAGCLEPPFR